MATSRFVWGSIMISAIGIFLFALLWLVLSVFSSLDTMLGKYTTVYEVQINLGDCMLDAWNVITVRPNFWL